jgi:serine protease AprX
MGTLIGVAACLSGALAVNPVAAGVADVSVIVRERDATSAAAEKLVLASGGVVGRQLSVIHGFEARVPANRLRALAGSAAVVSVTRNAAVRLHGGAAGYDGTADWGSMYNVAKVIGADKAWTAGYTGKGVDIALIDSGVVPVRELNPKVVNGPDLSFESQVSSLRHLDTFGHGTHMAGIIAGRTPRKTAAQSAQNPQIFTGIAPGSRLVSIKVAAADGSTDVSQVIAAISWVIEHAQDPGFNIRVLNLSFGTDSVQSYLLDPLAYAAEAAWRSGIVVVVAAGNAGFGGLMLNDPATDPYVIAVGANDLKGTYSTSDDQVASFSSSGVLLRRPDFVAPGKSIISLRNPGSFIDSGYPEGRVGTKFFRGSGTSQAAAVTSGAVALLLQQRPSLTPDQVKWLLKKSAEPMPASLSPGKGSGVLSVWGAIRTPTPMFGYTQNHLRATGLGLLELSRGTAHLLENGIDLIGEQDIMGKSWLLGAYVRQQADGTAWVGGDFMSAPWSGDSLGPTDVNGFQGRSWTGRSWTGRSWSGQSWQGRSWTGRSWTGSEWSGGSWDDQCWSPLDVVNNIWSIAGFGT